MLHRSYVAVVVFKIIPIWLLRLSPISFKFLTFRDVNSLEIKRKGNFLRGYIVDMFMNLACPMATLRRFGPIRKNTPLELWSMYRGCFAAFKFLFVEFSYFVVSFKPDVQIVEGGE